MVFVGTNSRGPWARAEALLSGTPDRELPRWAPAQAPNLRFVQSLYAGVDDFPFDRFPPPIEVASNSGAYAPFVAEHAIALVLALAKNLPENFALVRRHRLRPAPSSRNLVGKTALILGYGGIGREVASRLRSFGMRVQGLNRKGGEAPGLDRLYPARALAAAVSPADVIVDARPLTIRTRRTINARVLSRMKDDALYVNVGRAWTVDPRALYRHLRSHPRFAAATDVWWTEDVARRRLESGYPLDRLPNFIGTPHVAGYSANMSREARARIFDSAVENLSRFFVQGSPKNLVDRAEYA